MVYYWYDKAPPLRAGLQYHKGNVSESAVTLPPPWPTSR